MLQAVHEYEWKLTAIFPDDQPRILFDDLILLQPGVEKSNLFLLFPVLSIIDCLKITEKVSLDIASEANFIWILNVQKFIKDPKNRQFWRVFENLNLAVNQWYQTS